MLGRQGEKAAAWECRYSAQVTIAVVFIVQLNPASSFRSCDQARVDLGVWAAVAGAPLVSLLVK